MIGIACNVSLTIIGDGRTDEVEMPIKLLNTPEPLAKGLLPTSVMNIVMGGVTKAGKAKPPSSEGITGTYDSNTFILTLRFDIPPSSARVSFDMVYSKWTVEDDAA